MDCCNYEHAPYAAAPWPPAPATEYLYGGKEARSRRGLRERERERPRPPYRPPRWSNGLEYGEEMHPYIPECEPPNHFNWNYYQANTWFSEREQFIGRQMSYGIPSPMQHPSLMHHAPHQQYQTYRHDPLRGLAAMQANGSSLPVEEKMMHGMIPSAIHGMSPSCCTYTGNECSCGSCLASRRKASDLIANDFNMRHRHQQYPSLPKHRTREEPKHFSSDRPRKNKSPKISSKQEDVRVLTPVISETKEITNARVESVPLPAFQQAFGSTEIGRFSGAFVHSESDSEANRSITEEMVRDAIWTQLEEVVSDEWKDPPMVQLDACFEPLPSGPASAWSHNPAPTPAHHIY